ncbi:sugar porter family MFS transporter [Pseudomonas putida]
MTINSYGNTADTEVAAPAINTEKRQARRYLQKVTMIATFGGLLFGFDTGVINGALLYMKTDLGLTPFTEGLVTSGLLIGAMLGALASGRVSDLKGRRRSILFMAVLFFIGALGCSLAPTLDVMVAARFLLGLAVGGASVVVPAYLAEMSPSNIRGRIITRNELMIVTGQFLAFSTNAMLGNLFGDLDGVWRWMLALATLPAVALWFGMLYMPESPRWLATKGRVNEALAVLKLVREEYHAKLEMAAISKQISNEKFITKGGWRDLSQKGARRIFFIGIGIAVTSQFTGVNSIMYFGTQILTEAGLAQSSALIANVVNGVISIAATFVGIYLLDRVGRRPMMLLGFAGTTLSLLLIGLVSVLVEPSVSRAMLILGAMALFLASMQGLIGPAFWVLLAEIFPMRIRGGCMGMAISAFWLTNVMIGLFFPTLVATIGIGQTFFAFVGAGVLSLIFVALWVPETRGSTLEEIEQRLYG